MCVQAEAAGGADMSLGEWLTTNGLAIRSNLVSVVQAAGAQTLATLVPPGSADPVATYILVHSSAGTASMPTQAEVQRAVAADAEVSLAGLQQQLQAQQRQLQLQDQQLQAQQRQLQLQDQQVRHLQQQNLALQQQAATAAAARHMGCSLCVLGKHGAQWADVLHGTMQLLCGEGAQAGRVGGVGEVPGRADWSWPRTAPLWC